MLKTIDRWVECQRCMGIGLVPVSVEDYMWCETCWGAGGRAMQFRRVKSQMVAPI